MRSSKGLLISSSARAFLFEPKTLRLESVTPLNIVRDSRPMPGQKERSFWYYDDKRPNDPRQIEGGRPVPNYWRSLPPPRCRIRSCSRSGITIAPRPFTNSTNRLYSKHLFCCRSKRIRRANCKLFRMNIAWGTPIRTALSLPPVKR